MLGCKSLCTGGILDCLSISNYLLIGIGNGHGSLDVASTQKKEILGPFRTTNSLVKKKSLKFRGSLTEMTER